MGRNESQIFSVSKGHLYSWVTLGVFWGVCTCSNSIYTTIPMPLYSYLVSPVSSNLEFIHNNYYFWWEFSLRMKQKPDVLCFALTEIVCDMDDAFKFVLLLPAVLLNTFSDNAMLCSWYKKHLFFLDAWLVFQVYRNGNGVKNYWLILYQCYESLHCLFFYSLWTSPTAAYLLVFSPLHFL